MNGLEVSKLKVYNKTDKIIRVKGENAYVDVFPKTEENLHEKFEQNAMRYINAGMLETEKKYETPEPVEVVEVEKPEVRSKKRKRVEEKPEEPKEQED